MRVASVCLSVGDQEPRDRCAVLPCRVAELQPLTGNVNNLPARRVLGMRITRAPTRERGFPWTIFLQVASCNPRIPC